MKIGDVENVIYFLFLKQSSWQSGTGRLASQFTLLRKAVNLTDIDIDYLF